MLISLNKFRNRKNIEQFFSNNRKSLFYEYGSGKKSLEDFSLLKEDLENLRNDFKSLISYQEIRQRVEVLETLDHNQVRNPL